MKSQVLEPSQANQEMLVIFLCLLRLSNTLEYNESVCDCCQLSRMLEDHLRPTKKISTPHAHPKKTKRKMKKFLFFSQRIWCLTLEFFFQGNQIKMTQSQFDFVVIFRLVLQHCGFSGPAPHLNTICREGWLLDTENRKFVIRSLRHTCHSLFSVGVPGKRVSQVFKWNAPYSPSGLSAILGFFKKSREHDTLVLCYRDLDTLHLRRKRKRLRQFSQSLTVHPSISVTKLHFDCDLPCLSSYSGFQHVTHLTFGDTFNQPVDQLPLSITHLVFGYRFNKPVNHLPAKLTFLQLGNDFDQPVDQLPGPLDTLIGGARFRRPLDHLPLGLRVLNLRNCPSSLSQLPSELTDLKLGGWIGSEDTLNHLPSPLKRLTLSFWNASSLQNPFSLAQLPSQLQELDLEIGVYCDFDRLSKLVKLKCVLYSPLEYSFPSQIQTLHLLGVGTSFRTIIPDLSLLSRLRKLHLCGYTCPADLDLMLPSHLEDLFLDFVDFTQMTWRVLPGSLLKLNLGPHYIDPWDFLISAPLLRLLWVSRDNQHSIPSLPHLQIRQLPPKKRGI